MRRLQVGTLARVLLGTAAFAVCGCPHKELAPITPCTVSAVSQRVDQSGVNDVDLLFMIDDSGSMANKQKKLAEQLPRLLQVLTVGDRCAGLASCPYDENSTPKRMFTPVRSLHLGVVTSNMGGIDTMQPNVVSNVAINSCVGLGDDGILQTSTKVATEGVQTAFLGEFQVDGPVGTSIIEPLAGCDQLGDIDSYQSYDATSPDADLDGVEKTFACVSRVGVRGCPFEQQLEAPWKALAPSTGKGDLYRFLNGSDPHGDRENADFLRPDALLAILLITDEDDCSITDAGKDLFDPTHDRNTLNFRCGDNADDPTLVHATSRYVDGFKSLKPDHTDRVIFAAITGVPPEAITAGLSPDDILALPAMQWGYAPPPNQLPNPSCTNSAGTEVSYPPIRIVKVARDFGNEGVLYSVCEDNYGPALDLLIAKIASKLTGNCLPHALHPDQTTGQVNCEVYELLPMGVSECDPNFGLEGVPISRTVTEAGQVKKRKACKMTQVTVTNEKPAADEFGWYYDNFSDDALKQCGDSFKQRISFQFKSGTTLPSGAGATFECFQPVAKIDKNAVGFDAINTQCTSAGDECAGRSNGAQGGYDLSCMKGTCQVECKANPECPPGWVCASDLRDSTSPKFCQQPTCPSDDSLDGTGEPDAG